VRKFDWDCRQFEGFERVDVERSMQGSRTRNAVPSPKNKEVHKLGTGRCVLMKVKPGWIASNSWADAMLGKIQVSIRAKTIMNDMSNSKVSNSSIVKMISERSDVKSVHVEGRDMRNRSWIRPINSWPHLGNIISETAWGWLRMYCR